MAPSQKRKAGVHTVPNLNKPEKKPKLNPSKEANDSKKGKLRTLEEIAKELPQDDDLMADFERDWTFGLGNKEFEDDEADEESDDGSQAEEKGSSSEESEDDPTIDQYEMEQAIMRDSEPGRKKALFMHEQSLRRTALDNQHVADMDDEALWPLTVKDTPGGRYDLFPVEDGDDMPGEAVDLEEIDESGVLYDPKTKEKFTPANYAPPVPKKGQRLPPSLRGKAYVAEKVSAEEAKRLEAAPNDRVAKGVKGKAGDA